MNERTQREQKGAHRAHAQAAMATVRTSLLGTYALLGGGSLFAYLCFRREASSQVYQFWLDYNTKSHDLGSKSRYMEEIYKDFTQESVTYGPLVKKIRTTTLLLNLTTGVGGVVGGVAGYMAARKTAPASLAVTMTTTLVGAQFVGFAARYTCSSLVLLGHPEQEQLDATKQFMKYFSERSRKYTAPGAPNTLSVTSNNNNNLVTADSPTTPTPQTISSAQSDKQNK